MISDEESIPLIQKPYEGTLSHSASDKFKKAQRITVFKNIKICVLFLVVVIAIGLFSLTPELKYTWQQVSVTKSMSEQLTVNNSMPLQQILRIYVRANFISSNPNLFTNNLKIRVTNPATNHTISWEAAVSRSPHESKLTSEVLAAKFEFTDDSSIGNQFIIHVGSNTKFAIPAALSFQPISSKSNFSAIYAVVILTVVYGMIIFELVHRAVSAMIGALVSLATLAVLNERPSLDVVLSWLDYETLCLLFGMMLLVVIFSDTGFFDWTAVMAYKMAGGKTWPLITILCIVSAVTSAFLDNVTTILLLTPITIRLCEVLCLDAKHVLMAEVIFSNIGGTATAIGDPPNIILLSNNDLKDGGIDFGVFTLHMLPGSLLCLIAAYIIIRITYRRKELMTSGDPPEIRQLKAEIAIWEKQSMKICVTTREETIVKALLEHKIRDLEQAVHKKSQEIDNNRKIEFKKQVEHLEERCRITDRVLLVKSGSILTIVIALFLISSFVSSIELSPGWIPVLCSIALLVLSDYSDLDSILHRIEWSTLLFFAALFVLMQAVEQLELISWITHQVTKLVMMVDESSRLSVSILIILWISALVSSFIDNIPFTTAMVPIIVSLSRDPKVELPLQPLVWALSFGACLGGNGTLVGASANVVCTGLAESHGQGFTFREFFKIGFPTMIVTTIIASIYLLLCHVAFTWH